MVIYGLTYTFTSNYGTCLQGYALQTVMEQKLNIGEKVDYKLIPMSKSIGYKAYMGKSLKHKVKNFINSFTRKSFIGFEKQHMKYAPIEDLNHFEKYNDSADCFVCGSDVIWNPKYNHGIERYYLDFAKKYAFSYAASFGESDIAPEKMAKIGKLISKLDGVGVREKRSAEIAESCTDKKVEVVLDPVLLLNRNEWDQLAEKENKDGKYIFVYSVNSGKKMHDFVEKLSQKTGLKVIRSGGNSGAIIKQKAFRGITPERWLQLVRDAQYVVTDSFHGTAFASLYGKTFYTIVDGDPDKGFNVRMTNYLRSIGLENRYFTAIPDDINLSQIDYTKANVLLNERIEHSMNYIRENVEAAYRRKSEA